MKVLAAIFILVFVAAMFAWFAAPKVKSATERIGKPMFVAAVVAATFVITIAAFYLMAGSIRVL